MGRVIIIQGLVQGVGFRPFVYKLATARGLNGWVENRADGVRVVLEAGKEAADRFARDIRQMAPPAAEIFQITTEPYEERKPARGFEIRPSSDTGQDITEISPDIAVCDECLRDMKTQPHRIKYPFINCTRCGPRFTIIRDLPYDRAMTTMEPFAMCPECRAEYENVLDRRFHAQPVACNRCGPHYSLQSGGFQTNDLDKILTLAAGWIQSGEILAIKGLGGYFLTCDAANQEAVSRLRELKNREGKPFAVMFRDVDAVRERAFLGREEEDLLCSWRKPIVLLKMKKSLAPGVSNGLDTLGAMLPYMPFHYLLFEQLGLPAVVMTSANFSDEPILKEDDAIRQKLRGKVKGILSYNREIHNRADDSVTAVFAGRSVVLRRSRGWVPNPVRLQLETEGILAAGAELVNVFCAGRGRQAILSQHIGDLKNMATWDFYRESIGRFERMFRLKPTLLVRDLHPDYLSSRYADERASAENLPLLTVQHHHAHIASCLAEHGLDEPVIGVSFDGVGLGDDGNIWGGEILRCDLKDYQRLSHFAYVPMPGGDKASREPWRMAVSYLKKTFGPDYRISDLPVFRLTDPRHIDLLDQAIEKKLNTPLTSSAGRLFDAVAALTGLCLRSTFHAEAPMRLEAAIDPAEIGLYPYRTGPEIHWEETIRAITREVLEGVPAGTIAARFHNTVAAVVHESIVHFARKHGLRKAVLSGGTFQNRYLTEKLVTLCKRSGIKLLTQQAVPMNDGGIALGQLAIAAKRRSLGLV